MGHNFICTHFLECRKESWLGSKIIELSCFSSKSSDDNVSKLSKEIFQFSLKHELEKLIWFFEKLMSLLGFLFCFYKNSSLKSDNLRKYNTVLIILETVPKAKGSNCHSGNIKKLWNYWNPLYNSKLLQKICGKVITPLNCLANT